MVTEHRKSFLLCVVDSSSVVTLTVLSVNGVEFPYGRMKERKNVMKNDRSRMPLAGGIMTAFFCTVG